MLPFAMSECCTKWSLHLVPEYFLTFLSDAQLTYDKNLYNADVKQDLMFVYEMF